MTHQEKKDWLARYRDGHKQLERLKEQRARAKSFGEKITIGFGGQPGAGKVDRVQLSVERVEQIDAEMAKINKSMGNAVSEGYNSALDINSPSRVAMQSAQHTVRGYEIPFEESVAKFEVLGAEMANAVDDGYVDAVETQMARAEVAMNNVSTSTYGGDSITNHGEITFNVQKLTDAELYRAADFMNNLFGRKMTVKMV